MLPIVKHRTMHIPHRVALVAASICLILSFTVEQVEREDRLSTGHDAAPSVEQSVPAVDPGPMAEKPDIPPDKRGQPDYSLSLLPWFAGPGRQ
ncbi:MAG: hypothetical protein HND55_05725 [Pseudomonadota bacterium]|nr:MAG: hypothetical protein HND55_05725 [Pseudomonadota bacterium]